MEYLDIEKLLIKKTYEIKLADHSNAIINFPLRVYYPKYRKILDNENFWKTIKKRNNISDTEIEKLFLFLQFYTFNTLKSKTKERKKNPLNKYKRNFNPQTLLYYPSFNSRYNRETLRNLSSRGKNYQVNQILGELIKHLELKDLPLDELYLQSVYAKDIKNYLPLEQTLDYFREKLELTNKLYREYSKEDSLVNDLESNIDNIQKTLFSPSDGDFIRKHYKSMEKIILDTYNLLNQIHIMFSNDLKKGLDTWEFDKLNTQLIGKRTDEIWNKLQHALIGFQKSKKKGLRKKVQSWIKLIEEIKSKILPYKIHYLSWILTEFADKSGTYELLLRISEKMYHVYYSQFLKEVLKILIEKEKLSATERRFFIAMNVGIPFFNYRISLLDKVIYNYLSFDDKNFEIAFNFLFRPDLKMKNRIYYTERSKFLISYIYYLNLYPIWAYVVKSYDSEKKALKFGELSFESIENFIPGTIDIAIESEDMGVSNKFKNVQEELVYYRDQATFELVDLFERLLPKQYATVLTKFFIEGFTEGEISNLLSVSQPRINAIKNKAIKILSESQEIKNIYNRKIV